MVGELVNGQYQRLQGALAEGWAVEQPVYAMNDPVRPKQIVYQFILWRDGKPLITTVEDSAEIRQFIEERQLKLERLY